MSRQFRSGIVTIVAGCLALAGSAIACAPSARPPGARRIEPIATSVPSAMGSGMMGGGSGGMMGGSGGMMNGAMDMGTMMGAMMANAPGPRISWSDAQALGVAQPAAAIVDQASNSISFQSPDVHLAVVASPEGGPDMTFRIAGLADPTVTVPKDATVTVQFIQADRDTSHGWLLTAAQPPFSSMPMMDTAPAFAGSSAMALGNPTDAGMHSETISFSAGAAGQYTYLCPVMGHAQQSMYGSFIVQ